MNDGVLDLAGPHSAGAVSEPPFLYDLDPGGARGMPDDTQSAPIDTRRIDATWITVAAAVGDVHADIALVHDDRSGKAQHPVAVDEA